MRVQLAALAASVATAAGGLGWWVHPGAGLLLAGAGGAAWALLWDDGAGGKSS